MTEEFGIAVSVEIKGVWLLHKLTEMLLLESVTPTVSPQDLNSISSIIKHYSICNSNSNC